MALAQTIVVSLYVGVLALLSIYGVHRCVLMVLYHRYYRRAPRRPLPPPLVDWPGVVVQLPLFNERYVAMRVIEAAAAMRYPREKLLIQVLDDSTDDTRSLARACVDRLRARGVRADYLHREVRTGFKAGALEVGLASSHEELAAVFDADFVPPADFLERTVPYFQDSAVGMVQARWTFLNRDYSLLTRVQALLLDAHFMLEHTARNSSGRYFNFNGTGGIFRRAAIVDAGGWKGDTLTEDLDLSYRTQLRGWRFVFLRDVECPSELPVDILGLKNQQHRWTKGSVQVARKILPRLWRSNVPFQVKVEATMHLSANLSYLLLVMLSLLMPVAAVVRASSFSDLPNLLDVAVFGVTTVSIFVFHAMAQRELSRDWPLRLRDVPFILALGVGMCVNNACAVMEAILGRETPFVRTAKYRIENAHDRWKGKLYHSGRKLTFLLEIVFALYVVGAIATVVVLGQWTSLPYLALFLIGFGYVSGLSLLHARR